MVLVVFDYSCVFEQYKNKQRPIETLMDTILELDKVGTAADAMAGRADAIQKEWVPDLPDVLFRIPMLKGGQTGSVRFMAPSKPGEYPYLCTFPGHWRVMRGVMVVK